MPLETPFGGRGSTLPVKNGLDFGVIANVVKWEESGMQRGVMGLVNGVSFSILNQ